MPPAMFQRRILSYPTDEKPAINCVNLGLITKSAYALSIKRFRFVWRAGPDSNRWMAVLQTAALASSPPAQSKYYYISIQEY